MNRSFKAQIIWLTKEQGGRNEIPFGDKYAPIINVTKSQPSSNDFWSVFVINKTVINRNQTESEIKYLSEHAPDNLDNGVEFELYEGPKLVARGVVLHEV